MRESRWLPALGLNPPGPGTGYRNLAEKRSRVAPEPVSDHQKRDKCRLRGIPSATVVSHLRPKSENRAGTQSENAVRKEWRNEKAICNDVEYRHDDFAVGHGWDGVRSVIVTKAPLSGSSAALRGRLGRRPIALCL
jgi:hypothetical protein